jgi:two-component system chemotaxis response regulator CheY
MALNFLIVDDSSSMRSVIKKTIKATGIEVEHFFEAGDGIEALEVIASNRPDVILLDYHMPGMDGLALLGEVRKDEHLKNVPVLVTSVEGSQKRVDEFLKTGATDYIQKPFTPEEIRDKLNKVLGAKPYEEGTPASGDEELDF